MRGCEPLVTTRLHWTHLCPTLLHLEMGIRCLGSGSANRAEGEGGFIFRKPELLALGRACWLWGHEHGHHGIQVSDAEDRPSDLRAQWGQLGGEIATWERC